MGNNRFLFLLICFFNLHGPLNAQTLGDLPTWVGTLMEWIPEEQIDDVDMESFFEHILGIYENPLDLNAISEEQLRSLLFLSPIQAKQIIQYRERIGSFLSKFELQGIEVLTLEQVRILSSLVTVHAPAVPAKFRNVNSENGFQQQLVFQMGRQIEKSRGYTQQGTSKSNYIGDPWRGVIKYRMGVTSQWQMNLTLEKDPGEKLWDTSQKLTGFDHLSAAVIIARLKNWQNIIIGDYTAQFGEGLGLWMGYATSKGSIFHGIAKSGSQSRMHTGTGESAFLRGVSGSVYWRSLKITPYLSYRVLDASLEANADSVLFAKTIASSGLHRTTTERAQASTLKHYLGGVAIERELFSGRIGLNGYWTYMDKMLDPDRIPRNLFRFRGNQLWNSSVYWKLHLRNSYFFGEGGVSNNGKPAFVGGLLYSLGPQLSWSFLYRNYHPGYHSYLTQAFGEHSTPQNERGYYTGLLYQPHKYFSVFCYLDIFEFPWLKYRVDAPSAGMDFMAELRYSVRKSASLKLRYRNGSKEENFDAGLPENLVIRIRNQQYRLEFEWKPSESWEFRGKVHLQDQLRHKRDTSVNSLAAVDSFFKPGSRIQVNIRMSFLKNWRGGATPIYFFENDVLHGHGSRPYQNPGFRYYCNIRLRINKNHSVWLNSSQSRFPSLTSIGTGLDEVPKNHKTDFKIVWRWIK